MSQRKTRLKKLLEHRSGEVDDRLAKLAKARVQEEQAKQLVEREETRLARAREERAQAVSKPFEVKSLTLSNDWLVSCARRADLARQVLHKAQSGVSAAQTAVVAAKNELRKIELIFQRLESEERVQAERVEQRLTDEFAAQRVAAVEKRRGES
jgi:flagellar export protein FliJ